MKKPKFIFYEAFSHWLDDSGGSVYIYSAGDVAYIYAFSFLAAGINRHDSENTMIKKAKKHELVLWTLTNQRMDDLTFAIPGEKK